MKQCRKCSNFFPDDLLICPLDKVELFIPDDKFIGKIAGGCYRILSKLAKGGMGTIYLAKHRYLEREVAVKILKPSASGDEHMRKRIVREAKICATIEHPNIVKVFDLATLEGSICIVMELLQGLSLKEALVMEGAMTVDRTVKIMSMTAEALSRAHSFNIVHRDIKPGNIFLIYHRGIKDFVKLLDFGIAFTIGGSRLTQEGMLLGTPPYVSPEQIRGNEPTKSSDIYSLGCVVHELLSGKTPFAAPLIEDIIKGHLLTAPEPITAVRPDVPETLGAVLLRMLEKDPGNRYQDAFELLDDMKSKGISMEETEREAMARSSEQAPAIEKRHEIEWSQYFNTIAGKIDEDTAQTMEFKQGVEAARELARIELRMKEISNEMEQIESKRREYQRNIGAAIDNLEMDLSKSRRELGKDKMEHIAHLSEKEHLTLSINKMESRILSLAGKRAQSASSIGEEEINLLMETANLAKRLAEVDGIEKKHKGIKDGLKGQIEDLKFQIVQLGKRLYEIEEEYGKKYEACRNELEKVVSKEESLRKVAAMAAHQVNVIRPPTALGKE